MNCPIKSMLMFHSYVTLPEGKPPFSYGFPMVFLWFSYGFPIFPWFSYGFPMVFLWFSGTLSQPLPRSGDAAQPLVAAPSPSSPSPAPSSRPRSPPRQREGRAARSRNDARAAGNARLCLGMILFKR